MKLAKLIIVLLLILNTITSVIAQTCYTVYDRNGKMVYASHITPVNLSFQIHETLFEKYPDGHLVYYKNSSTCSLPKTATNENINHDENSRSKQQGIGYQNANTGGTPQRAGNIPSQIKVVQRENSTKTEKVNYDAKLLAVCPSSNDRSECINSSFRHFCNSLGSKESKPFCDSLGSTEKKIACFEVIQRSSQENTACLKAAERYLLNKIKENDAESKQVKEDSKRIIKGFCSNLSREEQLALPDCR